MKAVSDDALAIADHIGKNGDGRNRHLGEANKRIADSRLDRDNNVANFNDSHGALPEADEFPPKHPDTQPDDQVHDRDDEADLPPSALADVAEPEIDRRRAGAVVRDTGV